MGKECRARLSRRLWGGTSLKTAAKEASFYSTDENFVKQYVSLALENTLEHENA